MTAEQIAKATYVGSGEHKAQRWWQGRPLAWIGKDGKATRPKKQLTSICPMVTETERDLATEWVRVALGLGQFRYYEGCKTYPKHIWYRDANGQVWFGFGVNQIGGTYKGWPISEAERREKFD